MNEMTIYALIAITILAIVVAVVVITVIFRLTNPNSKACKVSCNYSQITGFNAQIETTEKSTPSNQE